MKFLKGAIIHASIALLPLTALAALAAETAIDSDSRNKLPEATNKKTETYQTVAFYAEYQDHAVRWPNGVIKIFDGSGFKDWPVILERFKPFITGVELQMTDSRASADIVVDQTDELPAPYRFTCGVTQTYLGADNASLARATIKLRRTDKCIGDNRETGLYMHELGHALGFYRHTKTNDIMGTYENDGIEIHMSTLATFLTGLYSLDVGADIPVDKSYMLIGAPTDWAASSAKALLGDTKGKMSAGERMDLQAHATLPPTKKTGYPSEPTAAYTPLSSLKPVKMRPITVISPAGPKVIWEMEPKD